LETLQTNKSSQRLSEALETVQTAFGLSLGQHKKQQLLQYFINLHRWNKSINLTGIRDDRTLVYKHLGDSLVLGQYLKKEQKSLLDIGTGPGVPGLVIKIVRPDLYVVLAEAVRKKCSFLRYISSILRPSDLFIEEKRIGPESPPLNIPEGGFDVITSQATGSLKWLFQIARPFLSKAGEIIALKGPSVKVEMEEAKLLAEKEGFFIGIEENKVPILEHERAVVIFKRHVSGTK